MEAAGDLKDALFLAAVRAMFNGAWDMDKVRQPLHGQRYGCRPSVAFTLRASLVWG